MRTPISLLQRLRQPDEHAAWERFVDLYAPVLLVWVRQLGLQDADAADLVQDVFTILVENLPSFAHDPQRSFRAWLKTVLLNRWRNHQRRPVGVALEAAPEQAAASAELELDEAEYRRHLVRRAMQLMEAEFQPATWQACWLFVVEDQPAAAVAQTLNLTINAVYLAKSRVLRRLREELHGLLE